MNNYFSNLVVNLINKENTKSNLTTLLNNLPDENYDLSFHLNHKNYNEVYKIITNLKNDSSSRHNIPAWYLKPAVEYITSPMVHIINTSIDQEIFPKQWKISRVCPIPKTDNPTSIKDYRPVSVFSILSKVYERVILNQLCSFIEIVLSLEFDFCFRAQLCNCRVLLQPVVFPFQFRFCSLP